MKLSLVFVMLFSYASAYFWTQNLNSTDLASVDSFCGSSQDFLNGAGNLPCNGIDIDKLCAVLSKFLANQPFVPAQGIMISGLNMHQLTLVQAKYLYDKFCGAQAPATTIAPSSVAATAPPPPSTVAATAPPAPTQAPATAAPTAAPTAKPTVPPPTQAPIFYPAVICQCNFPGINVCCNEDKACPGQPGYLKPLSAVTFRGVGSSYCVAIPSATCDNALGGNRGQCSALP